MVSLLLPGRREIRSQHSSPSARLSRLDPDRVIVARCRRRAVDPRWVSVTVCAAAKAFVSTSWVSASGVMAAMAASQTTPPEVPDAGYQMRSQVMGPEVYPIGDHFQ